MKEFLDKIEEELKSQVDHIFKFYEDCELNQLLNQKTFGLDFKKH